MSPGIGEAVGTGDFGATPLLVLRALVALVLVLPWCAWAVGAPEPSAPTAGRPGLLFGLGAAFALVPCGLYAEAAAAARTAYAADLLNRERLARADVVLEGLVELGGDRPVLRRLPAEWRREHAKLLPRLRQAADAPLLPSASAKARFARAVLLIQLDRLDEAAGLLEPLATPDNDPATMILASVYRDQEKWAASDALYARVLDKLLPRAAADPEAAGLCVAAVEGLAFNARGDRRPADAERALRRGLEAIPGKAAQFHFLLGRHYHDGGRPGPALEHLAEAVRLDPGLREAADKLVRDIRTATPGCFSRGLP